MKWGSFTSHDYDINKLDRKEAEAYGEMQRLAKMQRNPRPLFIRLPVALIAKIIRRGKALEVALEADHTLADTPVEG